MQIAVSIERLDDQRFRARGGWPLAGVAEGTTRDEALARLRDLLESAPAAGESVLLDIGTPAVPDEVPRNGVGCPTPATAEPLERRVRELEAQVQALRNPLPGTGDWPDRISGSMTAYPEFEEVCRLGRAIRQADRLPDDA
jgi:hypothetical protein